MAFFTKLGFKMYEEIARMASGATGAGIAAWFARATGWTLVGMFLAGLSTAWFIAPSLAQWFGLVSHEGAIGFVVGFLAILVLRKVQAIVENFPAHEVGPAVVDWIKSWLGSKT